MNSRMGTRRKPPATPMSVPKAPINKPIAASKSQIMVLPSVYFFLPAGGED